MEDSSAATQERETYLQTVDETLKRIAHHKGVVGFFVMEPTSGKILKFEGFDDNTREVRRYLSKMKGFIDLATSTVKMIDWKDDLTFLRLSYGSFDALVAPDLDKQYTLVVIQHIG